MQGRNTRWNRNFPEFPTSKKEDNLKRWTEIFETNSRKFLFHAILNRTFRKFWPNGTCPLFQLKLDALSEVKCKRRRTSATTGSTHVEKEVATAPSSDQSLDLLQERIHVLQRQLKVCSFPTCLVLKTQSVLHLLVPRVIKSVSMRKPGRR